MSVQSVVEQLKGMKSAIDAILSQSPYQQGAMPEKFGDDDVHLKPRQRIAGSRLELVDFEKLKREGKVAPPLAWAVHPIEFDSSGRVYFPKGSVKRAQKDGLKVPASAPAQLRELVSRAAVAANTLREILAGMSCDDVNAEFTEAEQRAKVCGMMLDPDGEKRCAVDNGVCTSTSTEQAGIARLFRE